MKKIGKNTVINQIPVRSRDAYKGTFGRLLLVGGSFEMGGAIMIAASAAVRSGAGLVTVASHPSNKTALLSQLPEAMFTDYQDLDRLSEKVKEADLVLMGPGLGLQPESKAVYQTVMEAIEEEQILLLDGDALTFYSQSQAKPRARKIIMTPHPGEWERLSGIQIDQDSQEENQAAQEKLGAIIVLKKSRTEIYTGQEVYQNTSGNPGQATGGMGDCLAGMIAGFVVQASQTDPAREEIALLTAVYLHSAIADQVARRQYVVLPTDIISHIPAYMKHYEHKERPII